MARADLIPSISYDQHEIIRWIIELHLDGQRIGCDPTFGHGGFYTPDDIAKPRIYSDINPAEMWIPKFDCRDLPYEDNSIESIMFDPPFLIESGKGSKLKEKFGTYPTMSELWEFYGASLQEFYRILQPGGHLIFKCQDTVTSGKNYMSHVAVMRMAYRIDFYPKDIFLLLAKQRMGQWNIKKQRHARKFHSYFWVFQKLTPRSKTKVRYY